VKIDYSSLLPQVLVKLFPDAAMRDQVTGILGRYGREDFHLEVVRVHLGILRLSGADLTKIEGWTAIACRDFRDLLVEAEYRRSFGKDRLKEKDPAKYEKLERKEQDEYRQWLARILESGNE
jgi:hypothetical protein